MDSYPSLCHSAQHQYERDLACVCGKILVPGTYRYFMQSCEACGAYKLFRELPCPFPHLTPVPGGETLDPSNPTGGSE